MANIKSAEKKNRQRIKREARNRAGKSEMRTAIKKLRAAVATKDQAYALFLLSLPLFLLLWFVSDRWPRAHAGEVLKTLLPAAIVALLLLLLVDGAITNTSGFARRVIFLAGPASQDYAEYVRGPSGWLVLLSDMLRYFAGGYGLLPMALAAGGLGLHFTRTKGARRLAGGGNIALPRCPPGLP